MSQIDTGLGWLVNSEWAYQAGGIQLGSMQDIGGPYYQEQPIPHASSPQEAALTGYYMYDSLYFSNPYYEFYAYAKNSTDEIFIADVNNSGFAMSLTQNAVVGLARKTKSDGTVVEYSQAILNQYDSTTGLYYSHFNTQGNIGSSYVNPNLLIVSTEREALDAISFSQTVFYKLNAGYAVCCFAKWYTPEGTEQTSPILISTEEDAVKISTDGTTEYPYSYTNIQLYEGRSFYMTMILNLPGDVGASVVPLADLRQFAAAAPSKVFALIADYSFANIVVTDSPDPYQEGDGSEEGGADGGEDEEENVDFTDPPSTNIGATGFLTIFCPSLGQLQNLAYYMWNTFDIDNWRRLFANPMDAILGLHIIPVPPAITGTKTVKVAGFSTEIEMDYTSVRYIRRPLGTCDIPKKWGAYLDYNPYTKVSIFLPYIGFKELDTDDIMGKTIALQYIIDILTGACVAELKCGDTVLYSWQGNCANEVPITSGTWRGAIASALGIAGAIAKTALTGGASAPMIAGTIASVGANSLNLKPTVDRSGAIAGSAGFMGNQRPYIIRSIPNLVIPTDQNKFIGYPSFVTASLGSLTGYNEIASVHLEGIPATGNELAEIETLLKGGVIL